LKRLTKHEKLVLKRASFLFVVAMILPLVVGQVIQPRLIERWNVECTYSEGQVRDETQMYFYAYENAREWATSWAVVDSTLACRIETVYLGN